MKILVFGPQNENLWTFSDQLCSLTILKWEKEHVLTLPNTIYHHMYFNELLPIFNIQISIIR